MKKRNIALAVILISCGFAFGLVTSRLTKVIYSQQLTLKGNTRVVYLMNPSSFAVPYSTYTLLDYTVPGSTVTTSAVVNFYGEEQ